jgi:hypothetical protein
MFTDVAPVADEQPRTSTLTPAQRSFAVSREPFPAFVGGYGSGKSAAAIARAMALKAHFRTNDIAYYLPTYPLVEDIAFKRFPELCDRKGWAYKLHRGNSPGISFPGAGKIVFRTMENPDRIVGYEVAHSILDELDTLTTAKAQNVWNKVIARNRQKMVGDFPNTVAVATTPEGFKFVWEKWEKLKLPGYVLFRAKTMDNAANLPPGYIDNLRNSYPAQLLAAYLDGEFVNLTAGSVYTSFDRRRNHTNDIVRPATNDGKPADTLHIGMDFNVGKMAAVVHVIRDTNPRAVSEINGVLDTPAMCLQIRKLYPRDKFPAIMVYPDASGQSRKSNNASESDLTLLKQAGFVLCVNLTNPAVKDRVLSMNKIMEPTTAIVNADGLPIGTPRYLVNTDLCPIYTEGLEKQAYDKNGEPDKTSGLDHAVDAGGYFITYKYPVVRRLATVQPFKA